MPNTPPVVSGPFMLTSWTHGQGWTLDRNPNYWGTQPAIAGIDYRLYSNQEAMIQALKNGEIDAADGVDPPLVASLEGTDTVTVQRVVSDWWLNLAFNFGGQGPDSNPLPALHDHDVRLAIEMAIDKQAIADKVYQGTASPGDTFIRPASAYWHLDIPADEEIPYDPVGANTLLDKAGYTDTDGDGIREDPANGEPLHLLMPASSDTTGAVESGELIVGYLKKIGISVDLKPSSDAKMNDYWGAGNFDAYIWYWSGDPDPDYQLFVFTSDQCGSWSDGCWKDPKFDAMYERQNTIMDPAERLKVIQEAQRYEYEQIPASCSPIPAGSRPTATTASPAGSARRASTGTSCPATTTTRSWPCTRSPAPRSARPRPPRCRGGSGWPSRWRWWPASSSSCAAAGASGSRRRSGARWGRGGTSSARACRPPRP